MRTIRIKQETPIPGTDYVLEAGDSVQIESKGKRKVNESDDILPAHRKQIQDFVRRTLPVVWESIQFYNEYDEIRAGQVLFDLLEQELEYMAGGSVSIEWD